MTLRAALLVTALASAGLIVAAEPAAAQRRVTPKPRVARQAPRSETVRAEFAGVLLQTKRYDEAVREYRALIGIAPSNAAYKLGLARALAWGGHPRDAEPVLAALVRSQRADTAAARMLVEVRLALEPGSAEAAGWVREFPRNSDYRLALARAYVRERRYPQAFAAFDTLLASSATVALLREAAGAHAAARDSTGNVRLLARAVALNGGDSGLRRDYAAALSWSGDRRAAIAEYTDLLRRTPNDADLLFLRGRLEVWGGDYGAGERDLTQSLARRPSREAYALLGDMYRWRGDYQKSRQAYASALALSPGDTTALAGLAELERLRSGVVASGVAPDVGWTAQFTHSEDNAGFLYLASGLARGFELGRGSTIGVAAEQRRISARSSRAPERYVYGVALSARAAHQFDAVNASATGGVARHGGVRDIPFGDVRLSGGWQRTSLSALVSTGPVYLPLVSAQSLVQFNADGVISTRPLVGRTAQLAGSTPLGALTLSASAEVTSLNDGNRRTSGYLGAAYPVAPDVSLLYSGFALGYSQRSDRYWDPTSFTSHSIGAQYAWQQRGPLSFTARVLSGVGRATEVFPTRGGDAIRATGPAALQLAGSGEAAYRSARWELAATAGYARGRGGEYQSLNSSLRLRLIP